MRVTTTKLIQLLTWLPKHTIEASLNYGATNMTHFLEFGGRKIFDIGIDSAEVSSDPEEFLAFYAEAYWRIDQIV
jgi:hypothetical protein